MYSSELIQEVTARNDIVDVISGYIQLKKNGSSYSGLCPFHNEKSPSFSVSPSRQIFKCFGCGVAGNVISFVMEYENYSFVEAVKLLGERAGMDMPETTASEEEKKQKALKDKLLEVNKIAATYFYKQLKSDYGKLGYEYLKKRELSDETINNFGLGYSSQHANLYRYLKDKGYADDVLKESGLFTYERGINDKFWNRVMFPIMDVNNKVIGFGGRVMGDAKPKYLNSPETKLFDKSRNLYGLNIARTARKNNLIICEGYMDVISMHQAGFNQAVASLGTALTPGQARLMKRYTDNVYITYDSDDAGTTAAIRAIPILKEAGLSTKVVSLKPYKDPDELIKALGAEAFQERLDKAENSFMFEISVIEKKYDRSDPDSATQFYREVATKLVEFSEKLERDNYLSAVCNRFVIPFEGMQQMVSNYGNKEGLIPKAIVRKNEPEVRMKKESGVRQAEKILLTWMIDDKAVFIKISKHILPEDFVDPLLKDVAEKLYAQYAEGECNPADIVNTFTTAEEHNEVAGLFSADLSEELSKAERERALNDTVIRVKANSIEQKLSATTDPVLMLELMQEQKKVRSIHIEL